VPEFVKTSFMIDMDSKEGIKFLSLVTKKDLGEIMNEAIYEYLAKTENKDIINKKLIEKLASQNK
jgi:hypothetical protein